MPAGRSLGEQAAEQVALAHPASVPVASRRLASAERLDADQTGAGLTPRRLAGYRDFMIPLRDENPTSRPAIVTLVIICS